MYISGLLPSSSCFTLLLHFHGRITGLGFTLDDFFMHCSADCIVVPADGLAEPIREPMIKGITLAYGLLY